MYHVFDGGYGDLFITRSKKVNNEDCKRMESFRTRREAVEYCCDYIKELCEREKDISPFYFGIEDRSFK